MCAMQRPHPRRPRRAIVIGIAAMLAFAGAGSVAAAVATSSGNAVSTTISVKPSHAGGSAGALERTVRTR
jgi:hypothetical protein